MKKLALEFSMNTYKLSVVTICYNAKDYIASTFDSIRKQKNKNFEYVVIDGGSNDGTIEIIKANQDIINYWHSEPDKGISDALNKGIERSCGEYIIYLHADDYFLDEMSTDKALASLKNETDIVAFDIYIEDKGLRRRGVSRGFNFYTNFKMPFYHPGVLCKRTLFKAIGGFDPHFKIAMDYDFLLRAYRANISDSNVPEVLTVFRDTGISSRDDWQGLSERFSEEKKAHYKNCRSKRQSFIYHLWWFFYLLYRKARYQIF
jgi:glycosyltransferase involved in cell wall biosynthesis